MHNANICIMSKCPDTGAMTCMSRATRSLPVLPGHEALGHKMQADASLSVRLRDAIHNKDIPDCYADHPVVKKHAGLVLPVDFFVDGAPYSHTDSVIGFWLVNMLNASRHLMVALPKRICCKCGCRGWCTLEAVFRLLHWVFRALAAREYPSSRHDGQPWDNQQDEMRSGLARTKPKMPTCLLYQGEFG